MKASDWNWTGYKVPSNVSHSIILLLCLSETCGSSWGAGSCSIHLNDVSPGRKVNSEESTSSVQILHYSLLRENCGQSYLPALPSLCPREELTRNAQVSVFAKCSHLLAQAAKPCRTLFSSSWLSYIQSLNVFIGPLLRLFQKGSRSNCQAHLSSGVTDCSTRLLGEHRTHLLLWD